MDAGSFNMLTIFKFIIGCTAGLVLKASYKYFLPKEKELLISQ